MTPPLDLATARRLAAEAVNKRGRYFVYNPDGRGSCFYEPVTSAHGFDLDDDDPRRLTGCLVGEILTAWGETRHIGSQAPITELVTDKLEGAIDDDTVAYLDYMQAAQDDGETWGEAFDKAEEWAEAIINPPKVRGLP